MYEKKLLPLAKSIVKWVPGVKELMGRKTGGTIQSRYCYSVWLRHLKHYYSVTSQVPKKVAELGPGDSLGIGLAALLSGCEEVHALDVYKYWDNERNLRIFEELVTLFKKKADIPTNAEYPYIRPEMDDYSFPSNILTDEILRQALSEERLNAIRKEIGDINNPKNTFITYNIPWNDSKIINNNYLDFIYSQAVLEHVEDLDNTYNAMRKWLKPSGLMSHSIDFKSHGTMPEWNGHWTYSDFEWNIIRAGKAFLINREPVSTHRKFHEKYNFDTLTEIPVHKDNSLRRTDLAQRFANLSDEDISTSGVYVLSRKV
jgi:hypothetical protein